MRTLVAAATVDTERHADPRRFHARVIGLPADGTDVVQLTLWELDADIFGVSPARYGPIKNLVVFQTFR